MNKGIFIDRDGTINKLMPKYPNEGIGDVRNYVVKWDDFEFLDGAKEAFALIEESEYIPIVVSNQGGAIGRGLVDYNSIDVVFSRMVYSLNKAGCDLYYYFCPHLISDNCACIKPKPGMLYQAAIEHNIDLSQSWMIGDMQTDIIAGFNAGIPPKQRIKIGDIDFCFHSADLYSCDSLLEAVKYIMDQD